MCVFLTAAAVATMCLLAGNLVAADNSGADFGVGDFCVTPHSDAGRCVPLRSCPPLLSIVRKKPINPEAVAFLRSSECSFGVSKIRIFCCATHAIDEKPPIRNLFTASFKPPKPASLPMSSTTGPTTIVSTMTSSTTKPPSLASMTSSTKERPTQTSVVTSSTTESPTLASIMTSSPTEPPTLDRVMTSLTTTTEPAALASTEGVLATPGPAPADGVDAEGHPNDRLLPRMCGPASSLDSPLEARETELHEHPWTVLLRYHGGSSGSYLGCGGALISKLYVLTAAHCTSFGNPRGDTLTSVCCVGSALGHPRQPLGRQVVSALGHPRHPRQPLASRGNPRGDTLKSALVGEHELGVSPDCREAPDLGGEECANAPAEVPVEREIVHPEFSRVDPTRANDVALLRLDADVVSTIAEITPICLPSVGFGVGSTSQASLAGWGVRGRGVGRPSKWQGSVGLVPCAATLDARTQTCVVRGDGACALDDGGVLVGVGVGRLHVVAIAAHSLPRCSGAAPPAVFTRVDAFVGWIVDQLEP